MRLFIALWPDDAVRAAIADSARAWRWSPAARAVPAERLHLTLHFLGAQPAERLPALEQAIDVRWPGCDLALDRAACWRQGVAVLEPSATPPSLADLHDALAAALAATGAVLEDRRWRPHVTLARDAGGSQPPGRFEALRWRVDGHALVVSLPGQGYRVLCRVGCRR